MGSPPPGGADEPSATPLTITLGSPQDLPLLYAHQLVVNFTGNEFYVTVYRIAPEPWTGDNKANPNVDAVPLARFAFSPLGWLASVESFSDQVQRLHAEGHIGADLLAAARKAVGK